MSVYSLQPHLSEDESLWVAAVQAEDESDGLEEFLDAGSKLLLLHAAGGSGVKDARLDDKLEQILQSLMTGDVQERNRWYVEKFMKNNTNAQMTAGKLVRESLFQFASVINKTASKLLNESGFDCLHHRKLPSICSSREIQNSESSCFQ